MHKAMLFTLIRKKRQKINVLHKIFIHVFLIVAAQQTKTNLHTALIMHMIREQNPIYVNNCIFFLFKSNHLVKMVVLLYII